MPIRVINECGGFTFDQWWDLVVLASMCLAVLILMVLIGGGILISCLQRKEWENFHERN